MSRVSGAIAPFIMYGLFQWDVRLPWILLFFLDIIAMYTIWKYPKDLT